MENPLRVFEILKAKREEVRKRILAEQPKLTRNQAIRIMRADRRWIREICHANLLCRRWYPPIRGIVTITGRSTTSLWFDGARMELFGDEVIEEAL